MTPKNIESGFKSAGIFPFNPDVFPEDLYFCSLVIDQLNPNKLEKVLEKCMEDSLPKDDSYMLV